MPTGSPPSPAAQALARVAETQARAARAGITLRTPPLPPTTCCGRGCNGCEWEGYFEAVSWWLEEAAGVLPSDARGRTIPHDR